MISTLITNATQAYTFTAVKETDARTAVARGLAEYLGQLRFDAVGGRRIEFKKVFSTWASPEDHAEYPSAIIYSTGLGVYDASKFTPSPNLRNKLPAPDGRYLVSSSEFVQDFTLEIWANDPSERRAIVAGLEEAMNPVDWMYGFVLQLPHYFNERGTYAVKDMQYLDTEVDAMRRYRKAAFTITASVPVVNLFEYPLAKPRFLLDELDTNVVLENVILTDC